MGSIIGLESSKFPSEEDYRAAREYLERAVPAEHRVPDTAAWERAVRKCAYHTMELRWASEKLRHAIACAVCGSQFQPVRLGGRFCSDNCRKVAHERRRRGLPENWTGSRRRNGKG